VNKLVFEICSRNNRVGGGGCELWVLDVEIETQGRIQGGVLGVKLSFLDFQFTRVF